MTDMTDTTNTWVAPEEHRADWPPRLADIACYLCRRRKVKCDRTLPHCRVCMQTDQVCEYPLRSKKPGPKIGSLQRNSRQYRDREGRRKAARTGGRANTDGRKTASARSGPGSSTASDPGVGRQASSEGGTGRGVSIGIGEHGGDVDSSGDGDVTALEIGSSSGDNGSGGNGSSGNGGGVRGGGGGSDNGGGGGGGDGGDDCDYHRTAVSPVSSTQDSVRDAWSQRRRNARLNINDLSFILHPSHEASTPEKEPIPGGGDMGGGSLVGESVGGTMGGSGGAGSGAGGGSMGEVQDFTQQACFALGMSPAELWPCIDAYFDNMVAVSIFHQPTFADKLRSITAPVQLYALLAAMVGYALRFVRATATAGPDAHAGPTPEDYVALARRLVDRALEACGDDPPTLVILQAAIITAHCELTRGVHGRAWRSLGLCIRLAYEMNLHLVDAGPGAAAFAAGTEPGAASCVSAIAWREAEERRRAWWAIFSMDVFSSTIRRTPTAVNWQQMETLLPVDDAAWFADRPTESCCFARDPVQRWKALQNSGNAAPDAWFIVINSMMKEAQIISSPHGVPVPFRADASMTPRPTSDHCRSSSKTCPARAARAKLEILANAVQCFALALPPSLQYRNQYLSFEATASPATGLSLRLLHCGIHNIFIMTQLARLMIYRYDLFSGAQAQQSPSLTNANTAPPTVAQYFEAADNVLTIASRSCEDHVRYINPFLLSTFWLAAAVQLVRRHMARSTSAHPGLIKSRFDVLYMTYKRCAAFWNARTAMEQNLELLEAQLEHQNSGQDDDDEEDDDSHVRDRGHSRGRSQSHNHSHPHHHAHAHGHGHGLDRDADNNQDDADHVSWTRTASHAPPPPLPPPPVPPTQEPLPTPLPAPLPMVPAPDFLPQSHTQSPLKWLPPPPVPQTSSQAAPSPPVPTNITSVTPARLLPGSPPATVVADSSCGASSSSMSSSSSAMSMPPTTTPTPHHQLLPSFAGTAGSTHGNQVNDLPGAAPAASPSILDYLRLDPPTMRTFNGSGGSGAGSSTLAMDTTLDFTSVAGTVGSPGAAGVIGSNDMAISMEHSGMLDPLEQEAADWRGFSLLNDIHDLLSGF